MRIGRWLILVVLALTIMGLPVAAQADNFLQNPGFEEPFVEVDLFGTVAQGWTPWFVEDGAAPASPFFGAAGADRILIGQSAQLISSVFATAQAGVYQTALVPSGATVAFSVSTHVWSSVDEADTSVSTVPGLVTMQAGIDPTGGTDPQSPAIVWAEPVELYDSYQPLRVVATAQADMVTVFVRATIGGDTYVSDIYLDDAVLAVSDEAVSPTSEAVAPTEEVPAEPTEDSAAAATPEAPTDEAPVATEVAATEESVTEAAPTEETPTEDAPVATEEAATEVAPEFLSEIEYVVQSGDNFYDIAVAYGSTVDAILAANAMEEDTIIYPGDVLKVPVTVPEAPIVTEEPTAEPTVEPTPEPTAEPTADATPEAIMTEEPRTEEVERVVQRGDTLTGIAREFGVNEFDLAAYNGFTVMDVIFVGQVIRVPAQVEVEVVDDGTGGAADETTATAEPTEDVTPEPTASFRRHVIVPGDTLSRIASRYGTTVRAILEINDIPNPNRILYGQVIRIPNE